MHKHILVIGGGVAGLRIAKELNATLISNNDQFVFSPKLPDLLTQKNTVASLPLIECHEKIIIDTVAEINTEKKVVRTTKSTYTYDYLVIATGASPSTIISGSKKYAHFFYTKKDAHALQEITDKHVVVVGAGPTGVEVASELAHNNTVTLIQSGPKLLPTYSHPIQEFARKQLREQHVTIRCGCRVKKITKRYVYADEKKISYDIVICAVGVQANIPKGIIAHKAILVNEHLQLPNAPTVFAAGDCAQTNNPLTAQAAKYEADLVISNIKAHKKNLRMRKNHFHNKGMFVSLSHAVALDSALRLYGWLAKQLRETYYQHIIRSYRK